MNIDNRSISGIIIATSCKSNVYFYGYDDIDFISDFVNKNDFYK